MPQIKSSFTEMICIKWLFFRVLNQVDFSLPETREAFQSTINKYWRPLPSKIENYVKSIGYKGIKARIAKDCKFWEHFNYCYSVYILHQIGMSNLTYLHNLQNSYQSKWSKNPFMLTESIIPGEDPDGSLIFEYNNNILY